MPKTAESSAAARALGSVKSPKKREASRRNLAVARNRLKSLLAAGRAALDGTTTTTQEG